MPQIYALKRVAVSLALFAVIALGAASTARADSIILNLNQGNGSSLPNQNYGTITLTVDPGNGNRINVSIALNFGARIINTGQDCSICFNSSQTPNPTLTFGGFSAPGYAGLNGGVPGTLHGDGYGDFEYGVDYTGGNGGGCAGNSPPCVGSLSFWIQRPGGFTSVNDLLSPSTGGGLSSTWAIDIICTSCPQGQGQTGYVGTTTSQTPTPEPASMLLLGSGLIGVAAGVRRRIRNRKV